MYESYFNLKEKPFLMRPDPDYLYLSKTHQAALSMLEYGLMGQVGFLVVSGEIGSGKTTLVRKLLQVDDPNMIVGLVTNTQVDSFEELLRWILLAFDLDYRNKEKVELYEILTDFLVEQTASGKRIVLIIDEAQHLSASSLEQVRMLSNVNADKDDLLQLVLVGQPELRRILRGPSLVQFLQRIAVDALIETLDLEDVENYIKFRMRTAGGDDTLFDEPGVYELIWKSTSGIPRLINLVCDTALLFSFAEQTKVVDKNVINDVIRDKHESLSPIAEY
ncbi:MAG: AAA family ATPase [Pseudomonadota bacterium]